MVKTKRRGSKEEDQDKAEDAVWLIRDLIELNPQIDMNQFCAACLSIWADRCHASGLSHKEFREETLRAVEHAKMWWKNE